MFNAHDTDYTVWAWIDEHVLNEDNLRRGIERKRTQTTGDRERLEERLAYYDTRLAANNTETERLKLLFTTGLYT